MLKDRKFDYLRHELMSHYTHKDQLGGLNQHQSIREKIHYLHNTLQSRYPFIHRMAIALYDPASDLVSTFVYSADDALQLENYQARLADCPSLLELLQKNQPRLVNDLSIFDSGDHYHTQVISQGGYRSSYTLPLFAEGVFLGFLFFNSRASGVFEERVLGEIDMTGHLIAFMLYAEQSKIKTLVATVRSAKEMGHHRDPETGGHLERMAHYSRMIARKLAKTYQFSDDFIQHIFLFSPLHDIGKLTIPDNILLKPDKLSEDEYRIMRKHSRNGRDIIDRLLHNYGLGGIEYIELLRNIALYHHEAVDGSGYPEALKQAQIPVEARIVAVADVFDALTSHRPYKPAWSNEKAFAKLREMAGHKLDQECVDVFLSEVEEIERIQATFYENPYG